MQAVAVRLYSLAPGAQTVLTGRLRLALKEEVFNHVVWIMDKSNTRRLGQCLLRGRAAWPVRASSELILLGDLRPGTPATAELQIYSPQRVAFEILSVETSTPQLRVVRQESVKGRVNLTIEVEPPTAGEIEEGVTIRTSHPKRPVLMVAIRGTVRGDVWLASSAALWLGLRSPGERVQRSLTVRCTRPELGEVSDVQLEGEGWRLADWRYAAGRGTSTSVLRVALVVPEHPGNHTGKLRLQTACGACLEAVVSCLVRNGEGT